jgi:ATP-binding cassette subfamily B protein
VTARSFARGTSRFEPARAVISGDREASWLRRAVPLVLAHRLLFVGAIASAFVALVVQVQIPTVIGHAIDHSLVRHERSLGFYLWLLLILGVVRWLLNAFSRRMLLKTAYRIEYDLRTSLYEHLTRLSFSFFDRVQSGELMARSNSDVRAVQMYLAQAPVILAQCAVAVIVFVQMLFVSPVLAFVAMLTMPFVGVVGIKVRRLLYPVAWLLQARLARLATTVDENINGARVVKSFAAEGQQVRQLHSDARRVRWMAIQESRIRSRWSPVLENLPRMGQALLLLVGGYLAYRGSVTVGTLVAFNAYILLLQPPFRQLGLLMMMGQRARASAQRIYAIFDTEPQIRDASTATVLRRCTGDVRFDNVWFGYRPDAAVLCGLDLHLRPGETVALVGGSGAGKSTVARLLARFYDPDSGAVLVDGRDVRGLTLSSLRHNVGMVTDEPFLFSVSIRDNIAYGRPDASFDDVVAAARAAGAHGFVEDLPDGYETVVGERGYTLSGGQRQRIAIARTLLVDPPILILDDATSAIDAQVEQQIHAALRAAMKDRTTIVIGHRVSTILLADRVAVLEHGRVIASGTHQELLDREPAYAEILAAAGDADRAVEIGTPAR